MDRPYFSGTFTNDLYDEYVTRIEERRGKMMRTVNCIGAMLALCLTSCAASSNNSAAPSNAGETAAIDAEKTAAMNDYVECVRERAQKLDDGNTDASFIALAIQPDCKDQFSRYVKIGGIGMDPGALAAYGERLEDNQMQLTTAIIQKMRSEQTHQN
jgi:hypothetical protein